MYISYTMHSLVLTTGGGVFSCVCVASFSSVGLSTYSVDAQCLCVFLYSTISTLLIVLSLVTSTGSGLSCACVVL